MGAAGKAAAEEELPVNAGKTTKEAAGVECSAAEAAGGGTKAMGTAEDEGPAAWMAGKVCEDAGGCNWAVGAAKGGKPAATAPGNEVEATLRGARATEADKDEGPPAGEA